MVSVSGHRSQQAATPLEFAEAPHVAVIEARFYDQINDMLIDGAVAALATVNATYEIITIPGSLEIPAAVQFSALREEGRPFDAFVVLGCVIRGDTSHYDIVCNESARGLMNVTLMLNLPLGNGILTVENEAQALERADTARLNKGGDAAMAALRMLKLKQQCGLGSND
jgi:6,7-dimethyl-8-ribityllumazine synthase